MAMYRCNECDKFVDDDYHPCELDVRDPSGLGLVCPTCHADIEELIFEAHAELLVESYAESSKEESFAEKVAREVKTKGSVSNQKIVRG